MARETPPLSRHVPNVHSNPQILLQDNLPPSAKQIQEMVNNIRAPEQPLRSGHMGIRN